MRFSLIIIISLLWTIGVILYFYLKNNKTITIKTEKNSEPKQFEKKGDKKKNEEQKNKPPDKVIINVIFESENEVNEEVFADLTMKWSEFKNGIYKVPESIKTGDYLKKESEENTKILKEEILTINQLNKTKDEE